VRPIRAKPPGRFDRSKAEPSPGIAKARADGSGYAWRALRRSEREGAVVFIAGHDKCRLDGSRSQAGERIENLGATIAGRVPDKAIRTRSTPRQHEPDIGGEQATEQV
jgi:hypothetical protein